MFFDIKCTHCNSYNQVTDSDLDSSVDCYSCNSSFTASRSNTIQSQVPPSRNSSSPQKGQLDKTPSILSIIFSAVSILSLFLPWMTLGLLSASGMVKLGSQDAFLLMILFLIGAIPSILTVMKGEVASDFLRVIAFFSLAATLFMLYRSYGALTENMNSANIKSKLLGNADIGIGYYVCCLSSVFLFLSSLFIGSEKK